MERLTENKIVLIVRETRLEDLKARFNTVSQARFYVERLGGNFEDYEQEHSAYHQAVEAAHQTLAQLGRLHVIHRKFLPNFVFGSGDIVIAIGQDGLVANTLKYLDGQPLIGVNPDPFRYDGILLPFQVRDLAKVVPDVFRRERPIKSVTMAKASLNNGQSIYAVNDLFIGPKSHGSARYTISHGERSESQSSSGVIVSTGLGSTGWFTSLINGACGVSTAFDANTFRLSGREVPPPVIGEPMDVRFAWDSQFLCFTVREPFPSRTSRASVVFGRVGESSKLSIESHMADNGVIFSDGIEIDFLEFNSGSRVQIEVAERQGQLVT